jgi:two-component system, NarL family, nitrate/nitrite response regulator NarL
MTDIAEVHVAQRIAIVEDHGLIAQTVATALTASGREVDIVPPPADGDLLAVIGASRHDLVLLDLDLGPWGDSTTMIGRVAEAGVAVVMVTGVDDPVRRAACVAAGAVGVVSKSSGFDALLDAVDRTLRDGSLLSEHERQDHLTVHRDHLRDEALRLAPFEELSTREAEVLGDLMAGRSVDDIARISVVSVATVRTQVRAILRKLDAPSQVAAIGRARDATWIPPQER